ncbi:SNARE-like domain protein [Enterococcus villorum]|uniref:TVP38/TMEM64 family membrane protein n=1 Tax=Enterococcus villorum TaxID=112904 RepID=A0A1V8YGU8_9ENTE|nr:VTT domain-containing protein [Enterococcus villorum]OQO70510.1 SNARE-like domain protein [Enterococcus villorum]OQO71837.1 SNARE-like domain protein [Enterococcus villorum]
MKTKTLRILLIVIGIILIIFIGYHLYLEYQSDIQLFFNPKASRQQLMESIRSHGFSSALILSLLMGIMCAVPGIPTSIIGVLVGLSFGPLIGTLINVFGNACGNILSIFLMQHLKLFDHSKKNNRWVRAIRRMRHPKIGLMIGYMVPIIPSSVINFAATTLNLQIREILLSIILGVIPSSLLYACGGEALFHGYSKMAMGLVASVLILTILIVVIYMDHRKRHLE